MMYLTQWYRHVKRVVSSDGCRWTAQLVARSLLSLALVLAGSGASLAQGPPANTPAAQKGSSKLAPDTARGKNGDFIEVIVQFKNAPSENQFKKLREQGATEKARLPLIKGVVVSLPTAALDRLADNPDVFYISPNREVGAALDNATPAVGAQIAQQYGWTGRGVGVAVIDSGVYDHPDLKGIADSNTNVIYQQDFVGDGNGAKDFYG
ncbi:MAG: S8 family serine peptidase, partial [Candidatus Acidiferrales bacterium]